MKTWIWISRTHVKSKHITFISNLNTDRNWTETAIVQGLSGQAVYYKFKLQVLGEILPQRLRWRSKTQNADLWRPHINTCISASARIQIHKYAHVHNDIEILLICVLYDKISCDIQWDNYVYLFLLTFIFRDILRIENYMKISNLSVSKIVAFNYILIIHSVCTYIWPPELTYLRLQGRDK